MGAAPCIPCFEDARTHSTLKRLAFLGLKGKVPALPSPQAREPVLHELSRQLPRGEGGTGHREPEAFGDPGAVFAGRQR